MSALVACRPAWLRSAWGVAWVRSDVPISRLPCGTARGVARGPLPGDTGRPSAGPWFSSPCVLEVNHFPGEGA